MGRRLSHDVLELISPEQVLYAEEMHAVGYISDTDLNEHLQYMEEPPADAVHYLVASWRSCLNAHPAFSEVF